MLMLREKVPAGAPNATVPVAADAVTVWGPLNVPALAPHDASQMFSSNLTAFLKLLVKDGQLVLNREDEIIRETLVTHNGAIVHPRILELAGIQK